jgi:hypothetical protein
MAEKQDRNLSRWRDDRLRQMVRVDGMPRGLLAVTLARADKEKSGRKSDRRVLPTERAASRLEEVEKMNETSRKRVR